MMQRTYMDFEPDKGPFPCVEMTERTVLGMFMTNPRKYIARASAEGVDRDCFYKTAAAYDAIMEAHARYPQAVEIDTIELISYLMANGQIDRCGGPSVMMEIYSSGYDFGMFSPHCAQLRECKARRMVVLAAERLKNAPGCEEAIEELKASLEAVTAALSAPTRAKDGKQSAA